MIAQIQIRRGTTSGWASASPVILASGEPGYDSTLKSMKIGDGVTEWASLPFGVACPYDVGDVLQTISSTSPATRWPGTTWSAIAAGTFLAAAGAGYAAGATGGSATISLGLGSGHAIISGIAGGYIAYASKAVSAWTKNKEVVTGEYRASGGTNTEAVELGGSTDSGDNRPPYYAVYMWRRTA